MKMRLDDMCALIWVGKQKLWCPSCRSWIMYVMTFKLWLICDIYFFFFFFFYMAWFEAGKDSDENAKGRGQALDFGKLSAPTQDGRRSKKTSTCNYSCRTYTLHRLFLLKTLLALSLFLFSSLCISFPTGELYHVCMYVCMYVIHNVQNGEKAACSADCRQMCEHNNNNNNNQLTREPGSWVEKKDDKRII